MKHISRIASDLYQIISEIFKKFINIKHSKFYPNNPRHDDVFIVEFPKSGITWLSMIIANINLLESKEKIKATFFNIHQYIPDIHTTSNLNYIPLWSFPRFRFIKSHDEYNQNYNFVIYIVRDPYKVMNSYYNFKCQFGDYNDTFENFVKNPKYGIKAWIKHVESWLSVGVTNQKIHLVKYEDLKTKPYEELKKIYKNLGLNVEDQNIKKSIDLSNITNMKMEEEFHRKHNPNYKKFKFIGTGPETFDTNMTEKIKNYIDSCVKSNKIYKKFYLK
tara:strand:- start:915 stop:1739 length:825 start_codon:yes stop_codon:yes gene_type:complete